MTVVRMHQDEVFTDVGLVRGLLEDQFPQWAGQPIEAVPSSGTDNAIYRLGEGLAVRLPRIGWAVGQGPKHAEWLPRLATRLPLVIPDPVALGEPGRGYPWTWSIERWLPGSPACLEDLADPRGAARDLAGFLRALQAIETDEGPRAAGTGSRGDVLAARDTGTREAIEVLRESMDSEIATSVWETALEAEPWGREPVWFHGDLLPGNLLVVEGSLHAVIDFAGLGVGDPACDLMIAWGLFQGESRDLFRENLEVDDATWARGRGHALSQALIFIPYYQETNPVGVAKAHHMLAAVLEDFRGRG